MKGLQDKVAIVTAAAGGGIGKATATRLAEEGAIVVVTDSHERRTRETAEELAQPLSRDASMAIALDVSSQQSVQRVVDAVVSARGQVDILVNNAGINVLGGVEKVNIEDWTRIFDVNLTGAFHLIRAVLPSMRKHHCGRHRQCFLDRCLVDARRFRCTLRRGEGGHARAHPRSRVGGRARRYPMQCGRAGNRADEVGREEHAGRFNARPSTRRCDGSASPRTSRRRSRSSPPTTPRTSPAKRSPSVADFTCILENLRNLNG